MDPEDTPLPTHAHRHDGGGASMFAAKDGEAGDDKASRFVLASGKEVRYNPLWQQGGDVIAISEFRLARYRQNPVVLADHDPTKVIGRGSVKIVGQGDDAALHLAVEWDEHDDNPTAILIAGQHRRGMRSAVSVGFMPGKGSVSRAELPEDHAYRMKDVSKWAAGMFFRHPDLYEGSSVAIPKDPNALQLRAWAMQSEDPDERLRRIVEECLERRAADVVLQAVRSDPQVRTAIESAALGAIPTEPEKPAAPADWWSNWP